MKTMAHLGRLAVTPPSQRSRGAERGQQRGKAPTAGSRGSRAGGQVAQRHSRGHAQGCTDRPISRHDAIGVHSLEPVIVGCSGNQVGLVDPFVAVALGAARRLRRNQAGVKLRVRRIGDVPRHKLKPRLSISLTVSQLTSTWSVCASALKPASNTASGTLKLAVTVWLLAVASALPGPAVAPAV